MRTNLFFDIDRTLWDFEKNFEITFKEMYTKYSLENSIPNFNEFVKVYRGINENLWTLYRENKISKESLRVDRFTKALEYFGLENHGDLANNMADDYIILSPQKTELLPYAIETLEYLKSRNYKMFLITNGFLEVQKIKIEKSNLAPYFTELITSEQAGYKKPNIGIFNYAFDKTNTIAENSVIIGDDLEADIIGGKNAGMQTVLFNPTKIQYDYFPDYEIETLKELKEIF